MGEMAQAAQEIDGWVSKLKSDLVEILRQQAEELDRRSEIRHPVSMTASIQIAGVVYQGKIKDLSAGGAWFVSVRPLVTPVTPRRGWPSRACREPPSAPPAKTDSLHLQWRRRTRSCAGPSRG